ncbi:hypothetical protein PVT67_00940 [Gallaecimonas kandeliae]|uniref:hypothetical protein n=1 Tax=Gallaecimonas kandeliae TaxID=3029055 RepID=UPI002648ED45|nr:hypothetical protein [Gallaecimonas kandeliae]WKE65854.1 hypothetical protein PVT67_00940 [Gallaecimonas kandeliae]
MKVAHSLLLALLAGAALPSHAADKDKDKEIAALRAELAALKKQNEDKIAELEQRISDAEDAQDELNDQTQQLAIDLSQQSNRTAANTFNPGIGVVLNGKFVQAPADYQFSLPGFPLGGEGGPGDKGFQLGESEINLSANVDDKFYGNLTLSFGDGVSVEEAFLQTLTLPDGLAVKFGRFFSSIGYLNNHHTHTDDFAVRPLVYQAFLGGESFGDDGVQLTWLAPTKLFWESGAEWYKGDSYPAAGSANSGKGTHTLFTHVGSDLGDSWSWRAGLSWLHAKADGRTVADTAESFSGKSDLYIADMVWKWAPSGNTTVHNAKIQAEYFHRKEQGDFTTLDTSLLPLNSKQDGWYVQGVYQFMPQWRAGLRYEELKADKLPMTFDGTALDNLDHDPRQWSMMVDWSNSEFSRIRFQYSRDQASPQAANLFTLQYIAAFGAHGAHVF